MREETSVGTVSRVTKLQKSHMPVRITRQAIRSIQVLTICIAIQGKDCLVQKFRNSSVMLELEHYRPKASKAWFGVVVWWLTSLSSSSSLSMGHTLIGLAMKNRSLDRTINRK